jgi:DNA-binding IclR family transcriptional regulator
MPSASAAHILPAASPATDTRSGTQSIERAVGLLRVIASRGRRGMRIAEVVAASGLAHATCFRMLQCLQTEGLVDKDAHTRKYFLGPLVHELGLLARPRYRLNELCDSAMRALAEQTQDTVYLSERSGLEAVCTARHTGDYPIKVLPLDVGIRRPLGVGAGGLAILGAMDPGEAESVVRINGPRYPAFGGMTTELMLAAVAETRQRGYSFLDSVATPGSAALGLALPGEQPVAAISIAAISGRMSAGRHEELFLALRAQVHKVFDLLREMQRIVAG